MITREVLVGIGAFLGGVVVGASGVRLWLEKSIITEYDEKLLGATRAMEVRIAMAQHPSGSVNEFAEVRISPEAAQSEEPVTVLKDVKVQSLSLDKEPNAFGMHIQEVDYGEISTPDSVITKIRAGNEVKEGEGNALDEEPPEPTDEEKEEKIQAMARKMAADELALAVEKVEVVDTTPKENDPILEGKTNDYENLVDSLQGPDQPEAIEYIEEEVFAEDDGRFKGHITIVLDPVEPTFIMDGEVIEDWPMRIGRGILVDFYQRVAPWQPPVMWVRNHHSGDDYEVTRVNP